MNYDEKNKLIETLEDEILFFICNLRRKHPNCKNIINKVVLDILLDQLAEKEFDNVNDLLEDSVDEEDIIEVVKNRVLDIITKNLRMSDRLEEKFLVEIHYDGDEND